MPPLSSFNPEAETSQHSPMWRLHSPVAFSPNSSIWNLGFFGHHRLTMLSRASRGCESESLLHPARLSEELGQRPPTIGPSLAPGEPRPEVWWLKKTRRRAMASAAVPSVVGKPRSYPDLTKLVMIPSRFELGDVRSERTGLHAKRLQGRDLFVWTVWFLKMAVGALRLTTGQYR
jgi:hypothetical protein